MQVCEVQRLGLVPYAEAWEMQRRRADEVARGERPPVLMLLEHPHTYTFGRSGHAENLLLDESGLKARGVEVHWVDRGGDVTYHGPGQLVGYPILPLGRLNASGRFQRSDYVEYVRELEDALIRTVAAFGVVAGQVRGLTGVWVQPDVASRCPHCPPEARTAPSKIAAIGVKVDVHGVTQHGFALNVAPDMDYWQGIVGCGLRDHASIALADLLNEDAVPSMDRVMDVFVEQFGKALGFEMAEVGGRRPEVGE